MRAVFVELAQSPADPLLSGVAGFTLSARGLVSSGGGPALVSREDPLEGALTKPSLSPCKSAAS